MPWIESDEDNARLLDALTQLAKEKGALERLAGALNSDLRAGATDAARRGNNHQAHKNLIASSTLVRWQQEGLVRVRDAQSHKKRLVFEFLERSPDFQTDLYRPQGRLPPGFLAYAAETAARLSQPFEKDLSKLDGAFELFRPAWTIPNRRDRVLISRLLVETNGGFTRFREEQDYIDNDFYEAPIQETDEGAVMFTAACIIFFGLGVNAERVKLFVADSWHDALNGPMSVVRISGTMIGVSGRRHNPGYPFIAIRARKPFHEIETGIVAATDPRLDIETVKALGIESS